MCHSFFVLHLYCKSISKKTENIDAMISDKESIINDLTDYKKSLIYEVVTGKRKVV